MHFSFGMLGQLLSPAFTNRSRQTLAKEGDIYVSVRHVGASTDEHSAQSSLLSSTLPQAA